MQKGGPGEHQAKMRQPARCGELPSLMTWRFMHVSDLVGRKKGKERDREREREKLLPSQAPSKAKRE